MTKAKLLLTVTYHDSNFRLQIHLPNTLNTESFAPGSTLSTEFTIHESNSYDQIAKIAPSIQEVIDAIAKKEI